MQISLKWKTIIKIIPIYFYFILLLLPIFAIEILNIQRPAMIIFYLLSLIITMPMHHAHEFKFSKTIIIATSIILAIGLIELAHLKINGLVYSIFCCLALLSGYMYPISPPKNPGINAYITPIFLIVGVIFYKVNFEPTITILTSNYIGAVAFIICACWCVVFFRKINQKIFWTLTLIITGLTVTRSVFLGLAIGLILSYYSFTSKRKLFITIIIVLTGVIFIAQYADDIIDLYYAYNLFSLTNKNFETGRLDLWISILSPMKSMDFILGGVDLSNLSNESAAQGAKVSAHNGYISDLVQSGILSMLLIITLGMVLVKRTYNKNNQYSKILTTIIIAYFFREFFEVSIHANNFPIISAFLFCVGLMINHIQILPLRAIQA